MDRIAEVFSRSRTEHRAALILFAVAGYPSTEECGTAVERAIEAGADIIELGVPFSDPMADGSVICAASRRALRNGMTLERVLSFAAEIREKHPSVGLILFSYMNPMFHYGLERLGKKLRQIGVDGILAVDLPLEERGELDGVCHANQLHLIPLVSPVTPEERIRRIVAGADGFVYCVNFCGTTGARAEETPFPVEYLEHVRSLSPVPVAAGFGISDARGAAAARHADGVIVGSAFVCAMGEGVNAAGRLAVALRKSIER